MDKDRREFMTEEFGQKVYRYNLAKQAKEQKVAQKEVQVERKRVDRRAQDHEYQTVMTKIEEQ